MLRKSIAPVIYAIIAAIAVAASVLIGEGTFGRRDSLSLKGKVLRCAIQVGTQQGLTVGYNYELLKRFAEDMDDTLSFIVNARNGSYWIDSLRSGLVDIVVLPFEVSFQADSVLFSKPIDSLTVWAVREDHRKGLEEIDSWIGAFLSSDGHDAMLNAYNLAGLAGKGRKAETVSPYDSLIKAGAERLGWDWRLLCAVVYLESQFHIEYRSRKGAEGLMQILPSTAAKMGVTDLFDPEENIKAGVAYLGRLQSIFRSRAADAEELRKFTLAAFNAGEGRLLDCINYASSIGADADTWEGLRSVIPHLLDEETIQVDSVLRLGTFDGTETIVYVDRVLALYENYKKARP